MTSDELADQVTELASFNSYTFNPEGVARAGAIVARRLEDLGAAVETIAVPPALEIRRDGSLAPKALGPAVRGVIRPNAGRRVFLCIHLDTVYPVDHPFREVRRNGGRLYGPGVVDAKGGVVVLLEGVRRFLERSPEADLGCEILFNSDEEIGSMSSLSLLREAAGRCRWGLVFEPTFPDGALVSSRKGSGTYTFVVRGREAHAGREFAAGRNALVAAAELVGKLNALNAELPGVTVNPGVLEAGSAPNVVPGLAVLRVNVRVESSEAAAALDAAIHQLLVARQASDGIMIELHGGITSPPKALSEGTRALLDLTTQEAERLGMSTASRPSGGTCDGNKLAAAGLAVVDSLGPTGGELHSEREYVEIASLDERAELLARVLGRLALER